LLLEGLLFTILELVLGSGEVKLLGLLLGPFIVGFGPLFEKVFGFGLFGLFRLGWFMMLGGQLGLLFMLFILLLFMLLILFP